MDCYSRGDEPSSTNTVGARHGITTGRQQASNAGITLDQPVLPQTFRPRNYPKPTTRKRLHTQQKRPVTFGRVLLILLLFIYIYYKRSTRKTNLESEYLTSKGNSRSPDIWTVSARSANQSSPATRYIDSVTMAVEEERRK